MLDNLFFLPDSENGIFEPEKLLQDLFVLRLQVFLLFPVIDDSSGLLLVLGLLVEQLLLVDEAEVGPLILKVLV